MWTRPRRCWKNLQLIFVSPWQAVRDHTRPSESWRSNNSMRRGGCGEYRKAEKDENIVISSGFIIVTRGALLALLSFSGTQPRTQSDRSCHHNSVVSLFRSRSIDSTPQPTPTYKQPNNREPEQPLHPKSLAFPLLNLLNSPRFFSRQPYQAFYELQPLNNSPSAVI